MNPDKEEKFLMNHLSKTFEMAQHDALVELVLKVAAAAGIDRVEGLSIPDYYSKRKWQISEDLVKDYADTNIAMASKVKELWRRLDRGEL